MIVAYTAVVIKRPKPQILQNFSRALHTATTTSDDK